MKRETLQKGNELVNKVDTYSQLLVTPAKGCKSVQLEFKFDNEHTSYYGMDRAHNVTISFELWNKMVSPIKGELAKAESELEEL